MPKEIVGQLYLADTVQTEQSGDEEDDDTQDESAVTCPATDTLTKEDDDTQDESAVTCPATDTLTKEDDDTQDESAVTCPAADTLKKFDLESDNGMLLRYVNISFSIHTCTDRSNLYLKKVMNNSQNVT